MSGVDYAAIEAGGLLLDAWTSYSFDSDLFTPADSFRLSLGLGTSQSRELRATLERLSAQMKPGTKVKLWVASNGKRALQAVGVIDARQISNDADGGTSFTVEGRDLASFLIGSAADPALYEAEDTLVSVARKAVKPWGLEVTADHVAGRDLRQARVHKDKLRRLQAKARALGIAPRLMSEKIAASIDKGTIDFDEFVSAASADFVRTHAGELGFVPLSGAAPGLSSLQIYQLRVKDVRPQSGETVWEYLDRHAKRNGLLMQMDPQGRLVFCGLEYNQTPSYRLTRRIRGATWDNNILSGGHRHDLSDAYRRVVVHGRAKGKDAARSSFHGDAMDRAADAVPYEKTLTLRDNSIKSTSDAQARAEYELAKSKQGSVALEYTVRGHSDSGLLFATDSIAHVRDEVAGIDGPYYITARTFMRSAHAGATTQLKLVPPGSIVLKEAA